MLAGASAAAEGQVFNVGGEEPVSLLEIAEALISFARSGTVRMVSFPAERHEIYIGDAYSSSKKIENTLGWRPVTDWRSGLARTVEFYRANLPHYR